MINEIQNRLEERQGYKANVLNIIKANRGDETKAKKQNISISGVRRRECLSTAVPACLAASSTLASPICWKAMSPQHVRNTAWDTSVQEPQEA